MGKSRPFAYVGGGNYFTGADLEDKKAGEPEKEKQTWSIPQVGISSQSLSEKPRLVKGYGTSLRTAGDKLPNWALPKLYPQ